MTAGWIGEIKGHLLALKRAASMKIMFFSMFSVTLRMKKDINNDNYFSNLHLYIFFFFQIVGIQEQRNKMPLGKACECDVEATIVRPQPLCSTPF